MWFRQCFRLWIVAVLFCAAAGSMIQPDDAAAQVAPSCKIMTRLKTGSSGSDVECLQRILAADPTLYPERRISGRYDDATEAAVKRFQERNKLVSADAMNHLGVVDARTREALNELVASQTPVPNGDDIPAARRDGGFQARAGSLPAPTVSPPGGTFEAARFPMAVTITAPPGTTIRYNIGEREPNPKCGAGPGAGPSVTRTLGSSTRLRAIACSLDSRQSSQVVEVKFTAVKSGQYCFTAADNRNLPYRVLRNGEAPADGASSDVYPFTEITTGYHRVNPQASVPQYAYIRANRCHGIGGPAGNYDSCAGRADAAGRRNRELRANGTMPVFIMPNGEMAHVQFKSYRNADACTLAQMAAGLGYPEATIRDLTMGSSLTVVKYTEREARIPGLAARDAMMNDVCVLHGPYDPDVRGVALDYEVHDGRTPEMVRPYFKTFADLLHGKGKIAMLRSNPLTSPSQQVNSGLGGNENYLQSILDFINIEVTKDADTPALVKKSLTDQLNLLKNGPAPFSPERVYVLARPAEVKTPELAQAVRDFILENRIPMLAFGGTPVALGGSCDLPVNKVIRVLTAPVHQSRAPPG